MPGDTFCAIHSFDMHEESGDVLEKYKKEKVRTTDSQAVYDDSYESWMCSCVEAPKKVGGRIGRIIPSNKTRIVIFGAQPLS